MRVFEILDEIIEAVETAKGVPMSSSAVVNRSVLLDLLDDLRDAFPGSLEDAREILEQRDEIVESARTEAERVEQTSTGEARELVDSARSEADQTVAQANATAQDSVQCATAEADRIVSAAQSEADSILARARDDAERTVAAGKTERDRLVSEHEVHRSATASASAIVDEAQRQAGKLRGDADKYVETNLSDLSLTLQKLMGTVERGRDKLQSRGGDGFGSTGTTSSGYASRGSERSGGFDPFDQNS